MSFTDAGTDPRAADVEVTDAELKVRLTDGRMITAPLSWFPRLLEATVQERGKWQLLGEGHGIHWPTLDEDLSVAGLVQGHRAPRGAPEPCGDERTPPPARRSELAET